jgi:hypothetical protein
VSRQRRTPAAREDPETVVEMRGDASQSEDVDAAGGKLDRERNSVQPAADLCDNWSIIVGEAEVVRIG